MAIKDTLAKLMNIEGIEEADINEITEMIEKSTKTTDGSKTAAELKEAKAVAARILEEKKKLAEKNSELEKALEEMRSGDLSEIEKAQKEVAMLVKAKEKLEASLEDISKKSALTERNYKLEKISGKLKFLDSVPEDMKNYAIQNAFSGVEDLDDQDSISKVLEAFSESHKGVLASDTAARGSGSVGQSTVADKSSKSPDKMTDSERANHLRNKAAERKII